MLLMDKMGHEYYFHNFSLTQKHQNIFLTTDDVKGFDRRGFIGMKVDNEYKKWLTDLKSRILRSQIKAAVRVNTELLLLYWDLGCDIVSRQMESVWGSGFFERLSKDLRQEFPDMKGFSERNLYYIKQFYEFYNSKISDFQQPGEKSYHIENKSDTMRHQVGDEILHQLGAELHSPENKSDTTRQQVAEELENHPIFHIPWGITKKSETDESRQ